MRLWWIWIHGKIIDLLRLYIASMPAILSGTCIMHVKILCFARWHKYNIMTMICRKTKQLWSTYDVYFQIPFCGVRHSFTANRRNIKYNQFEETWNAFIWFQETYKSLTRIHNIPRNHVDHIFTIYVRYKDISLLRYPNGSPQIKSTYMLLVYFFISQYHLLPNTVLSH